MELHIKDIWKIQGRSYTTAVRDMQFTRDVLGKKLIINPKTGKAMFQPVSVREYCDLKDLNYDEVIETLNLKN